MGGSGSLLYSNIRFLFVAFLTKKISSKSKEIIFSGTLYIFKGHMQKFKPKSQNLRDISWKEVGGKEAP